MSESAYEHTREVTLTVSGLCRNPDLSLHQVDVFEVTWKCIGLFPPVEISQETGLVNTSRLAVTYVEPNAQRS